MYATMYDLSHRTFDFEHRIYISIFQFSSVFMNCRSNEQTYEDGENLGKVIHLFEHSQYAIQRLMNTQFNDL